MKIKFFKIEATGNDFIVFDNRKKVVSAEDVGFWGRLCARRTGIGADGVLLVEKSEKYDFKMRYINADGGEVSMCGNGARAICWFSHHVLLLREDPVYKFETRNGVYEAQVDELSVRLKMTEVYDIGKVDLSQLSECAEYVQKIYLNTGVPHCVLRVETLQNYSVVEKGREIRYNSAFAEGSNVNFFEKISDDEVFVRTYERGVEDETLSCGTGITAVAVAVGRIWGKEEKIKVRTKGGRLEVLLDTNSQDIYLCGPVNMVFEGTIEQNG